MTGPDELDRVTAALRASSQNGDTTSEAWDWDDPISLPVSRNTAPFCAEVLGDPVSDFVKAVATETATPTDLVECLTIKK